MTIKNLKELTSPDIWELSENEDILIRKDESDDYRVLVNFKDYQTLKDALARYHQQQFRVNDTESVDLNFYLEDLKKIVTTGHFEDVTDQPQYFETIARKAKQRE